MRPERREYQTRTFSLACAEFRVGKRRVLLVAPTGAGKTIMLAEIAKRHTGRGGRVLVVVHRRELMAQTVKKLHAAGVDRVGVIAAGEGADPDAVVQVASVQTLVVRGGLPLASLVILDEAHHYVSADWGAVAQKYATAFVVGVTATPERSDGTPLGDLFESMVVVASVRELVDGGYLVPCDVIAPPRKTRSLCADPVASWRQHAEGRPGVVFAGGVAQARDLAAEFTAAGIPAACVDGELASAERDARLAAFDRGEIQVLTNCFVLTEGWDAPRAEVCMIARGCGSTGTYLQMVGRVLRPAPGKTSARLIDLRGVVHEHGLPDEDRTFSLEGRPISGGESPVKTCPECSLAMAIATRVCPECGREFPARECDPDIVGLTKIERADRERTFFEDSVRLAQMRGYRPGWVAHRFKEKFGRFPSKFWREHFPRARQVAA